MSCVWDISALWYSLQDTTPSLFRSSSRIKALTSCMPTDSEDTDRYISFYCLNVRISVCVCVCVLGGEREGSAEFRITESSSPFLSVSIASNSSRWASISSEDVSGDDDNNGTIILENTKTISTCIFFCRVFWSLEWEFQFPLETLGFGPFEIWKLLW